MPDRINMYGEIEEAKGQRAASAAGAERDYFKFTNTKPRRNARRDAPIGMDELEIRADPVVGSILERIVHKRLRLIWGPPGKAFIFKYGMSGVQGVSDPRAFAGGIEMDFVILNRPSGKEMALEVQGAHWHGPSDFYADTERALIVEASGRDYREIWEYEIMLGDDYLDNRILELIGAHGRVDRYYFERTLRQFSRELGAPES